MITGKLSTYPSFIPFGKTSKSRRQKFVGYLFAAIALGACTVFLRSCGRDLLHAKETLYSVSQYTSDGFGFPGFIVMLAAGFVAYVLISSDGGEEHIQKFHTAVMAEHVGTTDPGSSWRSWRLSWAGGWCGVSDSTLFIYSFDSDVIVTIPIAEITEISLSQRQVSAESQILGGAFGSGVVGVGGGTVHTQFITSWMIDVYLSFDANAHLPLSFAQNESWAKEVYGQLRQRGCICA